jgi:hypothetical protein
MRNAATICLLTLFLSGAAGSARAAVPGEDPLSTFYPGAPRPPLEVPSTPYAMSYSDEVARNLGVTDGHMDLFSTRSDPSTPYVSGGVGSGGAMLRLQWRP